MYPLLEKMLLLHCLKNLPQILPGRKRKLRMSFLRRVQEGALTLAEPTGLDLLKQGSFLLPKMFPKDIPQ